MLIKNAQLTLLKVSKKEGVGKKSGNAYLFYVATVVDDDSNVMNMPVDKGIV